MQRRRRSALTTQRPSTGGGDGCVPILPPLPWAAPGRRDPHPDPVPLPRFRMKCHLCVNYIEMQTDPAGCDYVIVSGARRKEERWDMKDNEQVLPTGESQFRRQVPTLRGTSTESPHCPLSQSGRRRRSWRRTPCSGWNTAWPTGRRYSEPSPRWPVCRRPKAPGRTTSPSTAGSGGTLG